MTWTERIERANEGRYWKRGFTREEEGLALSWGTCAVGEQCRLGRITVADVAGTEFGRLGCEFFRAVVIGRLLGRFGIRRAARLHVRIENLALTLDFARATARVKDVEETVHA